jgi:MFS family permease
VADVTPPGERAARFGLIGAGFGIGFVLGPALRGLTSIAMRRLPRYRRSADMIAAFGCRHRDCVGAPIFVPGQALVRMHSHQQIAALMFNRQLSGGLGEFT